MVKILSTPGLPMMPCTALDSTRRCAVFTLCLCVSLLHCRVNRLGNRKTVKTNRQARFDGLENCRSPRGAGTEGGLKRVEILLELLSLKAKRTQSTIRTMKGYYYGTHKLCVASEAGLSQTESYWSLVTSANFPYALSILWSTYVVQ